MLAAELVTATQARDELDEEVKQQRRLLEQVMTFVTTNQPQHTVAPTATVELEDLQAQIQDLDNTVNSPTGQFQALVTMVDKLENRMDMGGVQFGDFQFGCMSDMLIFLSTRSKDIDFGLFTDAFSCLHAMDVGTVDHDTALTSVYVITKSAYANNAQARISTSYRTAYPDIFGASDERSGTFGPAMSTYEKWNDRSVGGGIIVSIRESMKEQHHQTNLSITQGITNREIRDLAKQMLDRTKEFVLDMCHFVEDFYAEMAASNAIPGEEAWSLTCSLLFEIFRDIRKARSVVKMVKETQPLFHIWGALRTHEVMERFTSNQFRDDPALTGILVRHIVQRKNNLDGTAQLTRKLAITDGKVATLQADVRKKADKDFLLKELVKNHG